MTSRVSTNRSEALRTDTEGVSILESLADPHTRAARRQVRSRDKGAVGTDRGLGDKERHVRP